jgi:hypothetical protein
MELFNKYFEEIKEDTRFDQLNILDKQLMLPAIKHKWVSRLIEQKRHKNILEKKRKDAKLGVIKKLENEGIPTGIPKAALNGKVESTEIIRKIDEELTETVLIIEYLEKVEKIFSSITYDIGNATKLMVLETT